AGGAYLALDPAYPRERLAFMLEDSGARVVVGHEELFDRLPLDGRVTVDIRKTQPASGPAPEAGNRGQDVACLSYTSGSTGTPKGALLPHDGLVRLVCGTAYVPLSRTSVVGQMSAASFDPLMFEVWGALLNGGRLVIIPPEAVISPETLTELVHSEAVTVLATVSAWFNATVPLAPELFGALEHVTVGGEALNPLMAERALEDARNTRFYNCYGPTEVSMTATSEPLAAGTVTAGRIGSLIQNTQGWIVDRFGCLAPVGVPGELWLGGSGVARGYARRPALTAEKFVPDAFSGAIGGRLYRTGDLARWLPDGTLEFLGRIDHQVKIRGFRVEPGETEAVLLTHPQVDAAVVAALPGPDGALRLIGYAEGPGLTPEHSGELREFLVRRLPEYLVPAQVLVLDALPLLPNGKIDRKALPEPDLGTGAVEYVAPADETEETVARIWSEVLGVERVSATDHFFDLGGHSLHAVRVTARINQQTGAGIGPHDVLAHPTVPSLAAHIRGLRPGSDDIGRLMAELAQLSDDEAARLLEEEL
ncbi:non-ribosomal peptide synthetase, partial [Streptomyces camponoticapitis]|uniref:non-ribosomal peptide synthetase n=1 Tax=Streptomyces camponoticapitis TaxID=1616125 RepID=UPI00166D80B1